MSALESKSSSPTSRAASVAALIREELARRRISRQRLADQAKISISTLEKALSGRRPFTLATTIRLEEALGVSLRRAAADRAAAGAAAARARARRARLLLAARRLVDRGRLPHAAAVVRRRRAPSTPTAPRSAGTTRSSCLIFRESERQDAIFTQQGLVSVPNQSGHIYFVTNRQGQYRLIIVARPTIQGEMYGILTTLQVGRGAQLTPVAAPIAFVPLARARRPRLRPHRRRTSVLPGLPPAPAAHGRGAVRAVPAGISRSRDDIRRQLVLDEGDVDPAAAACAFSVAGFAADRGRARSAALRWRRPGPDAPASGAPASRGSSRSSSLVMWVVRPRG